MIRQAFLLATIGVAVTFSLGMRADATEPTRGLEALSLADGWLGRAPGAMVRGRVVLVDVFTYECINCVRVLPNLKRLYAAYPRSELAIIGVHTPEVPAYQGRRAYLERQTRSAAIPWPIAIDNDYEVWNAFGATAWPTLLVFDRHGHLVSTIVGDGTDEEVDAAIRKALGHGNELTP